MQLRSSAVMVRCTSSLAAASPMRHTAQDKQSYVACAGMRGYPQIRVFCSFTSRSHEYD